MRARDELLLARDLQRQHPKLSLTEALLETRRQEQQRVNAEHRRFSESRRQEPQTTIPAPATDEQVIERAREVAQAGGISFAEAVRVVSWADRGLQREALAQRYHEDTERLHGAHEEVAVLARKLMSEQGLSARQAVLGAARLSRDRP